MIQAFVKSNIAIVVLFFINTFQKLKQNSKFICFYLFNYKYINLQAVKIFIL